MKKNEALNNVNSDVLAEIEALAEGRRGREDLLLETLHQVRELTGQGISRETASVLSEKMRIPLSRIYDVITFYSFFSEEKKGRHILRLCKSAPCHVCGASGLLDAFRQRLGIEPGETTAEGRFTLETCECLGVCNRSPAVMVNEEIFGPLKPEDVDSFLEQFK